MKAVPVLVDQHRAFAAHRLAGSGIGSARSRARSDGTARIRDRPATAPARAAMASPCPMAPAGWWYARTARRCRRSPARRARFGKPQNPLRRPAYSLRTTLSRRSKRRASGVFEHGDRRRRAHGGQQPRMISAPVASPPHARCAAGHAPLPACQLQPPIGGFRTARRGEPNSTARAAADDPFDRGRIAQPGAGRHRIGSMQRRRVVGPIAAAMPPCAQALAVPAPSGALVSTHRLRRQRQRRHQPGAPAADRQHAFDRAARAGGDGRVDGDLVAASSPANADLGSVMRFMCGHRLQGRTNSTSGCGRRHCRSSSIR
jgi:hypothetical protein